MITKTLAERLRMMYIEMQSKNPGGVEGFDTPLFFEAIAQAEREAQAIGEPVAWMDEEGWFIRPKERNSLASLQEKYSIPLYRSPISTEARDKAIEAGSAMAGLISRKTGMSTMQPTQSEWEHSLQAWDQALSALRGE